MTNGDRPDHAPSTGLLELPGEALALLAEAVLALRMTGDLAVSWGIASANATRALGADDARLLRVDRRSGALFRFEESGVETPYLLEHGGPVEWVMRHDRVLFDEGGTGPRAPRETLLWQQPPSALATLPLVAGRTHYGFLLLAFAAPRVFTAPERLFAQSLADALALALERSRLTQALAEERARTTAAERRLVVANDAASSLMSIVAHELRSPLSSIKAYAETLADNLDNPSAPRARFLGVIDEECDRLASLVGDVHDLSRIESGECTLRLSSSAPGELGRDVCMRLSDLASRRHVTLEL